MTSPTVTVIDGEDVYEGVEVGNPERALAVVPDVRLSAPTPEALVDVATQMARILADIVNKQHLYQLISGKKYPQVEAWQTVARMDGVVAREVIGGVLRHEDGSYEAHVEAVRLSDGAVIGRASAICGESDDGRWAKAKGYEKRSMAVTRATSRVFRQQYAWVMVLAGFQPTPADEMGGTVPSTPVADAPPEGPKPPYSLGDRSITGHLAFAATGKATGEPQPGPDGSVLAFFVNYTDEEGGHKLTAVAKGALAEDIHDAAAGDFRAMAQQKVTVEGELWLEPWNDKSGHAMPVKRLMNLRRIVTNAWTLPVPDIAGPLTPAEVAEAVDA